MDLFFMNNLKKIQIFYSVERKPDQKEKKLKRWESRFTIHVLELVVVLIRFFVTHS